MRCLLVSLALMLPLALSAQTTPAAGSAAGEERLDHAQIDLPALIECRKELADFHYLAPALSNPLQAVALGWRPLPQANLFMTEFILNTPITVFGHATDHIGFTADSIIAVIDLPDPRPLAKELALETAIDTPTKAMFGKELVSIEEPSADAGVTFIRSVVLNVSNVASHPGKTLVGCSYSLDLAEDPPEQDPPAVTPAIDTAP
ncbi:MAG: hypothetical protein ABIO17_00690 [Pseudoxanthomonas sp.]